MSLSNHAINRLSGGRPTGYDEVYRAAYAATDLLFQAHVMASENDGDHNPDAIYARYATLDILVAEYSLAIDNSAASDIDSFMLLHNMSRLTDLFHDVSDLTDKFIELDENSVDVHIDID